MRRTVSSALALCVLGVLTVAGRAESAGTTKADICHWTEGSIGYVLLSVATNSAHFDAAKHPDDVGAGGWYADSDGDGYGAGLPSDCPGGLEGWVQNGDDCDDATGWSEEVPYDGVDNDCDPSTPDDDLDGDGFTIAQDCDDDDDAVNPGAEEVCEDGIDNDCDGVDEECDAPDNCTAFDYDGHDYLVCQGSLNLASAEAWCAAEDLQLAYIDTEAENTEVVDQALDAYGCTTFAETSYWIANVKGSPFGSGATWPSGSAVWASGEPNGDGSQVHLMRYCASPYGWNDVPPSYTWGWVCESAD